MGYRASQVWKGCQPFEPIPEMLTFPPHAIDADGSRSESSLDNFPIGRVNCNYPFGGSALRTVIDILRRRKIIPDLTEAASQAGLRKCFSECVRIAKQQAFVFV